MKFNSFSILLLLLTSACSNNPESGNNKSNLMPDNAKIQAIWKNAGRDQVPNRWWESAAATKRILLKPDVDRETLSLEPSKLNTQLEQFKADGYTALEIFAPWDGGRSFHGLDTKDHYQLDPEVGSMDDFRRLVRTVHDKGMAIIIFCNLGYSAIDAPFFLEACDAVREGKDIDKVDWFWWSDSEDNPPPFNGDKIFLVYPGHIPHWELDTLYNPEGYEFWKYSERAQKYYWTKWGGVNEDGEDVRLPQYNWSREELRNEVKNVIEFWLETGIDGIVIDAVNWYTGCDWESNKKYMTDVAAKYGNIYIQPEGAGGFREDPVAWITEGGYNSVQDYGLGIWWEGTNVIRDAIESGDPRPIETALQSYHDRVRSAGGTLYYSYKKYIHEEILKPAKQNLFIATFSALGKFSILWDIEISEEAIWILITKANHPAMHQMALRRKLNTDADDKCYTFLNTASDKSERVLVVLNFQGREETVKIDCSGISAKGFVDLKTNQEIKRNSEITVEIPAYGYRFFKVLSPEG
jgi:hypothetical protein